MNIRRTIFLFLLQFIFSQNCYCQWTVVASFPDFISDVKFINSDTGFISGNGFVGKTANGGYNWVLDTLPIYGLNRKLSFPSKDTGYLIGSVGGIGASYICKTIDGGDSWQLISSGISFSLYGLQLADNENGYAVGKAGYLIKTTNGFQSGSSMMLSGALWDEPMALDLVTYDTIFVTGTPGALIKSYNADTSWTNLGYTFASQDLSFINSSIGYVVGNSTILKTIDAGNNFTPLNQSEILNSYSCINTLDEDTLFVGGSDSLGGLIIKSYDKGANWIKTDIPGGVQSIKSVFFLNGSLGFAVSSNGKVLKTTNGGGVYNSTNNFPSPKNLFSLFPNPTTTNFTLQINARGTLTITNQLGQIIFKTQIEKDKTQISTAGFSRGIYFVQLVTEKNISTQKIIIQ